MQKYFDAHCHITEFVDIPENIGAITNATQMSEWGITIDMACSHSHIFGAIGIHPWYVSDLPNDWDMRLYDLLIKKPNIMVGEIGLDAHRPDIATQTDVFVRQFEIAADLSRGVHVHCVGAWDKMQHVLKSHRSHLPPFILFHRYSGNPMNIKRLANEYNAYFSYRDVTNKFICNTPYDRILIESDSDNPVNVIVTATRMADTGLDCDFYENTKRMLTK